jgi:phospholipid/cholesterol/gamma-HCH transport system substrate-binding protein
MKLTNETKVGLLAIVAIIGLIVGFNFLKGQNVFSSPPIIYAKFANVGSLEKSNPIKINGLPVGTVYNVVPADKEVNSVIVELRLTRDVNIPKNSVAFIDASILGSAFINIEKGNSNVFYKPGDTISTRLDKGLIGNIQSQVAPTITKVNETLDSLKLSIGALNNILDPNTKNNLRTIIGNLTVSSAELSQLLNGQTGALAKSLDNVTLVTDNLAKNNDAITSSIRNVEVTSSHLANANIEGTIAALQSTINELKGTVSTFNSNKGTLGLLMNDRQIYDRLNSVSTRLNSTALSAEILLDDIRVHPKRYVNISVFGGKTKADPLTSPAIKDSVPGTR